jgi:hypothetical protein
MSAADAAAEILRREQANPGSVPQPLLAKAQQIVGSSGTGSVTLPEQTIVGDPREPTVMQGLLGRKGDPPGKVEQFLKQATGAAFVGGDEFANAGLLGLPQATGMIPGKDTPGYGALRAEHPAAALGGQVAGLMNPANPANLAGAAIGAPIRGAVGGVAGRALAGGVEGAVAGGAGSGAITAAGGGSGDQIFNATATGAGVGGALGAAGSFLMEPGAFVKSLFAGRGAPPAPIPGRAGPDNNQAIIDAMRMRATAPPPKPLVPSMGDLNAPPPVQGPARPPPGLQQAPPPEPRQLPDLQVPGPMLGPEGPPMGLQQAPPPRMPEVPDLQPPPRPEATPSAAPHEPTPPIEGTALSTVHRPGPGDTGMGAEEARRALDTDALHMANRTAAVQKILARLPDGADSAWLARMSPNDRTLLAKYVGVTQAGDDTWRAVADALDASRPVPPIRSGQAVPNRAYQRGMLDVGGLVRLAKTMQHGASLGLDPSIEMMLQPVSNAAGMAAGTKLPAAQQRQPGQPIDILNLYGM